MDNLVIHKIDNYKIYGYTKKLLDSFHFHTNPLRADRERSLLKASFKLIARYKKIGFKILNKEWMFIKL